MANDGKFVDRFPNVRTAGRQNHLPDETAADCFTFPTSLAEAAEILSRRVGQKKESQTKATAVLPHSHYRNYNTQIKEILEANVKKGFENVRAELRETAYKSYWRDEVGKIPDQVPNLPIGMDPENTIFGHKPLARTTASELLNPKKCRAAIEFEDKIGKEFYRVSHNYSLPGEPKSRGFRPPVPLTGGVQSKGKRPISENSGRGARTLLRWIEQSALATTSKPLADFKNVHYYPLGQHRAHSGLPAGVTDDSFFGRPTHHNMSPVLKEPEKLAPLLVAFLFRTKLAAKKIGLSMRRLKSEFASADRESTGELPVDTVYSIVKEAGLNVDVEMMQYALTNLGYYDSEEKSISYVKFLDLLDVTIPVPSFGKYSDSERTSYKTVYKDLCADLDKKADEDLKSDIPQPRIRLPSGPGWCLAHLEDLPGQTTVDDVLRPNIAALYGLTPYDFFKPRSEQFIRDLFIEKVGLDIPDDIFKIVWDEGVRRDGSMSVETFKNILNEISTGKLEQMADTTVEGKTE